MAKLKDPVVGTRLPRDVIAELDVIAAKRQVTRSDVLRLAVDELLNSQPFDHANHEPERSLVT